MNKVLVNLTAAIGALLVASMTAAGEPVRVLASLPITYGLGSILLQGAEAQVVRAAPANLPASRQVSFFTGRGAGALEKAASSADAVIAVRSLWPEDPLYPMARRSNIRIVEIDAARPVDGALPGIALTSAGSNALEERPWLSINNLGRMADVIAADLVRLSPNDAKQIASNLADIKQRLLSLSAASESRLAELDSLSVISLSPGFEYLTSGLNLDVIEVLPPSTSDSDAGASLESFKSAIRDNEVRLVLTSRPVEEAVANATEDAGARLLILGELPEDPLVALGEITEQVIDGLADQQTY
ncbi:metal ABC transporter substrate-binding protein [Ectopseudomonas mendocina]|uniref:Metal ABC transporter substrate-binding protein n=2 Tax=Ectopseudomonas mendocina TaxID=300 RepID=A0ABD7S090_ECTME|nr:zinc ABC transporter substrate-binding protein [Pseudomonas mendocina]ALN19099.1 metal ABC transporter substrate-binding protein [Pseudomonas mendocina S5.2]KES00035.1 metal ABC transporter substrate-binding protein [Pseudomonas mendocina]MDF2075837.1 zinc ABC transporter substrate-binding protein [Pseudomonas mendocina]TRO15913.1 metal ABC transporter substrate-binding protein [Pseudomonas mendocina]TRO20488.1 metal ABC transporter substrate-binding protein [Pseudomonas mendocina]